MSIERIMTKPITHISFRITLFIVVMTTIFLANFIGILSAYAFADLYFLKLESLHYDKMIEANAWNSIFINEFPFLVFVILAIVYLFPILTYSSKMESRSRSLLVARRIINAPIFISAFSFIGWIIASLFMLSFFYINGIKISRIEYIKNFLYNMIIAGITVVIIYYILNYYMTHFLLSRVREQNKLSHIKNFFQVGLGLRLLFLMMAVSLLPVLLLSIIGYSESIRSGSTNGFNIILISFTLLVISIILFWFFSRTLTDPLRHIQKATISIEHNDFEQTIPVQSVDELGRLAESINDMACSLKEKELIKDTFGKAVDPRIRDHMLSGNLELGGEERVVTVLFSDIRGFTTLSENRTPEQIVNMLNRHFDLMSRAITSESGLVNKFIGDAVMAIFNAPIDLKNHEDHAVNAGRKMLYYLEELNKEFAKDGLPEIKIGIGIHTGKVLAGNIGSSSRLEYTVIGDAVNLASRVEGLMKKLNQAFIITEDTYKALTVKDNIQMIDSVRVKGREKLVKVYSVPLK